ncbi:quinone oxidoreductase family protein [Pseudonocardia sp. GCM10023141]|uniref:quinone oxidoreductase family protein n=1 Tax=Pseudonocardia sp. GCM10023141 TaxID=3252653 RepID=UPI00360AC04A
MRRIGFRTYGGPEVLECEHVPRPECGPGELLVEVAATGVTRPVVRLTRGDGNGGGVALPHAPGGDVAGTVVAVGEGVSGFRVGDLVAGIVFAGAYAEFALLPVAFAARVPVGIDAAAAVALVRNGQVALGALRAGAVQPGESVLVTGAAGGVGHLALQLARVLGASRVVAAVGSAAKAEFVRGLGADEVVVYDQQAGWGEPVDVVLDSVGDAVLAPALRAVAPLGRLVEFSGGGGTVDVVDLRMRAVSVIGFSMAPFAGRHRDVYEAQRERLWELARAGELRPAITAMPLEKAAEAHRLLESRDGVGKIVLVP